MNRRLILILILAGYLVLGILFAAKTPAWQAPDEPAHYNYIAYLVKNGSFPVLHFGDYPHGYLEEIKDAKFPPDMPISPIRYESHQPPLYYVLAAPIYSLTDGRLVAVRLLSVVLGAGLVLLAYGVARRTLPDRPAVALGAAAFVAFLPQHLATVSQVGNDVLAELLLAGVLFVLVGMVAKPTAHAATKPAVIPLVLGILLGLILITKTTAYIAVPLALGVLGWRWVRARVPFRTVLGEGLAVILPAALIAAPWYARNLTIYGWPDFLGLIRHDQIVLGQTRTAQFIVEHGWRAYWGRAAEWTFKSFVGVFGWMGVWLDSRAYYVLGLWVAVPSVAWVVGAVQRMGLRPKTNHRISSPQRSAPDHSPAASQPNVHAQALPALPLPREPQTLGAPSLSIYPLRAAGRSVVLFLSVTFLLALLTYIYYNISFLQHQGRYLFTALLPVSIFLAAGWESALAPRMGRIGAGVLLVWAAAMAAWGLWMAPEPVTGVPRWPVALTVAAAVGLVVASLLPWRKRRWIYAVPFALLPMLSLYALFLEIIPQLTR